MWLEEGTAPPTGSSFLCPRHLPSRTTSGSDPSWRSHLVTTFASRHDMCRRGSLLIKICEISRIVMITTIYFPIWACLRPAICNARDWLGPRFVGRKIKRCIDLLIGLSHPGHLPRVWRCRWTALIFCCPMHDILTMYCAIFRADRTDIFHLVEHSTPQNDIAHPVFSKSK